MKYRPELHRYLIKFPGGELSYRPVEGKINYCNTGRIISLQQNRIIESDSGFRPVCLTLYTSHLCNLDCSYCYVPDKEKSNKYILDIRAVEEGARIVLKNCQERNKPFVLGFHGGNEPLLNHKRIESYTSACRNIVDKAGISLLPFCTTNGVMSEDTAQWAASYFHGITLSWDGPPKYHNLYRRLKSGGRTSDYVERSTKIFSNHRARLRYFRVRCTITGESVEHMEEITEYFFSKGIKDVEYYPVFQNRIGTVPKEWMPESKVFVYNYLKARDYGNKMKMRISYSGSRMPEHHGRFCMVLQDNLTITPDGFLTNCFLHTKRNGTSDGNFFLNDSNGEIGNLDSPGPHQQNILERSRLNLQECTTCFNQFHCSKACPEICPFDEQFAPCVVPACTKEKWLGLSRILEVSGHLPKFKNFRNFEVFFNNISIQKEK